MPELRTEDIDNQEIFATGRWNNDEYSEADLDAMIEAHGKVGFTPPVTLGHSKAQKLLKDAGLVSAGWVENLRRNGNKLIADFKKVPGVIADLIRAGGLRKKSAEVYWEYLDEKTQTKLPRVLKAVGLLGTDIPAVTSLKDILALYKKLPDGPAHAFEDKGNEFRAYSQDYVVMAKTEKRGRDGNKTITPEGVRAGDEVAARVSKYQSGHDGVSYADAMRAVLEEDGALARAYRVGPSNFYYNEK